MGHLEQSGVCLLSNICLVHLCCIAVILIQNTFLRPFSMASKGFKSFTKEKIDMKKTLLVARGEKHKRAQ